ncbi:hypothetical protein [Azotobacter chroococcum]|uniref:hypothetical protein n=1 Tax=Azotobacter chroococcum TaxID=353 RepID=UPI00201E043F|nr:hypothetical protein [Azotobacter chroococcum]
MMRLDAKVEKACLSPKSIDFRKSIDGLAVLVEMGTQVSGAIRCCSSSSTGHATG